MQIHKNLKYDTYFNTFLLCQTCPMNYLNKIKYQKVIVLIEKISVRENEQVSFLGTYTKCGQHSPIVI